MLKYKVHESGLVAYIDENQMPQIAQNMEEFNKADALAQKKADIEKYLWNTKFTLELGTETYHVPLKQHDRIMQLIGLVKSPQNKMAYAMQYAAMREGIPSL
jgi:hypothetical protein